MYFNFICWKYNILVLLLGVKLEKKNVFYLYSLKVWYFGIIIGGETWKKSCIFIFIRWKYDIFWRNLKKSEFLSLFAQKYDFFWRNLKKSEFLSLFAKCMIFFGETWKKSEFLSLFAQKYDIFWRNLKKIWIFIFIRHKN